MSTPRVIPPLTRGRNAIYLAVAAVLSVPFLLCFPLVLVPFKYGRPFLEAFYRMHAFLLRVICGLSYRVTGQENLPETPVLIASAHQSAWETLFFHLLLNNPAMIAKKELFAIPILGSVMRANGQIMLDRGGSADSIMASFHQARKHSRQGRNVLIFPTGTRSQDAADPIKTGVLILYRTLKCPVVPVTVNSGDYVLPKFPFFMPGVIEVRILPAIPVGLANQDFMDRLFSDLSQIAADTTQSGGQR